MVTFAPPYAFMCHVGLMYTSPVVSMWPHSSPSQWRGWALLFKGDFSTLYAKEMDLGCFFNPLPFFFGGGGFQIFRVFLVSIRSYNFHNYIRIQFFPQTTITIVSEVCKNYLSSHHRFL